MGSIYSFNFTPDLNELKMERPNADKLHPLISHTDSPHLNLDLTLSPSLYSNNTANLSTTPSSSPSRTKRIKTEGGNSVHRSQNKNTNKLGDKIFGLEKLMPWEKRLPILTTLKEAYNYIKFLQAQLASLQSMPQHSTFQSTVESSTGEGMKNLNRQQLLQVLINSSRVQTILCSKQLCVFSAEQLNRGTTLLNVNRMVKMGLRVRLC